MENYTELVDSLKKQYPQFYKGVYIHPDDVGEEEEKFRFFKDIECEIVNEPPEVTALRMEIAEELINTVLNRSNEDNLRDELKRIESLKKDLIDSAVLNLNLDRKSVEKSTNRIFAKDERHIRKVIRYEQKWNARKNKMSFKEYIITVYFILRFMFEPWTILIARAASMCYTALPRR